VFLKYIYPGLCGIKIGAMLFKAIAARCKEKFMLQDQEAIKVAARKLKFSFDAA